MEEQNNTISAETIISIKGLSKSFDDLNILNQISLDLFKGENLAVMGRSGAGKSVLIKILIGLIPSDEGSIMILGKNLADLSAKELNALRLRIGFSFQSSALYDSMNVRENLEFPLKMNKKHLSKKEVDATVEEVLDAVGLLDKINTMPSELSGGQCKRIGIARTLILKPEIMFYDEPTAGLDPITSGEINELIKEVQKKYNTSSIIITHDMTCAKETSNRVAVLLNGTFSAIGTFDDVFQSDDKEIRQFFNYNFIQ